MKTTGKTTARMTGHRPLAALAALAGILALSACGRDAPGEAGRSVEDDRLRARAAAAFIPGSQQDLGVAWAAIEPLVTRPDPEPEDLLRAAIISYHQMAPGDRAQDYVERAFAALPDDPGVRYVRGNILLGAFEPEAAVEEFRAVLAVDPDDPNARVQLGMALEQLGDFDGALAQFQAIRELGVARAGGVYTQATYRIFRLQYRSAETEAQREAAKALQVEVEELKEQGIQPPGGTELEASGYGRVMPPPPRTLVAGGPRTGDFGSFAEAPGGRVSLPGSRTVRGLDLDGDGRSDLLALAGDRVSGVLLGERGRRVPVSGPVLPVRIVAAGDLDAGDPESADHHPAPELLAVTGPSAPDGGPGAAMLLQLDVEAARWMPMDLGGDPITGAHGGTFVDFDHDGDLDIVLATDAGLAFRRNDGGETRLERILAPVSPPGSTGLGPSLDVLAEDLDTDQDVDLLVVQAGGLRALSSLRQGRWEEATDAWGLSGAGAGARTGWAVGPGADGAAAGSLAVADLDQDALPDVLLALPGGVSWRAGRPGGGFGAAQPIALDEPASPDRFALADLDLDGQLDLLALSRDGDGADGTDGAIAWAGPLVQRDGPLARAQLLDADLDLMTAPPADVLGDGRLDLLFGGPEQAVAFASSGGGGRGLTLRLAGRKDSTHGVGAVVEVRAGPLYQRLFTTGEPLVVGLGDQPRIDVLFVRWSNGVLQRAFDLDAGTAHVVTQVEGLVGSCPFLYAWNGETYTFVSDVLGTTPLGLPLAPGRHVPFDHEEYVKIRGDQLRPRDGRLDVVLTEELREVAYLDRLRLHAIDHPADVEIEPNEGFVFPPFPEHHVHTFADVVAPARVRASNGDDVTELLGAVDGRHAQVFTPQQSQYYGLAEPWHLDLELARTAEQRAALAAAPRIRLALTGWLRWTDASVNVAAARHPTIAFEPPVLWIPDGDGWAPAGPPIGFPAGKTKTLVVDVTDVVDRSDPRLRLTTTLALSWDAIRIVLDADDAAFVDTPLEASSAELAYRGFSRRLDDPSGELPELFDWDATTLPRWDQHPGRYTRYGDVLPLLGEVDDRYVVFGSGDAVFASFDATSLPPLPDGWTRDWLLYLDGWAKDRDPNTTAAERVEPLPFHGMSDYPPPADEAARVQAHMDAWTAEWNTREGRRLIERLAPTAAR